MLRQARKAYGLLGKGVLIEHKRRGCRKSAKRKATAPYLNLRLKGSFMNYNIEQYDKHNINDMAKRQIYRLLQFSDFSEYIGTDLNVYGEYEYEHYVDYFVDENRRIYLLKINDKLAGFAFINNISYISKKDNILCVAEFFIMKKYRKKGYGQILAKHIFDKQKGQWEVFQIKANNIAGLFWEKVIGNYTNCNYQVTETENEDGNLGNVFSFNN